MIVISDTSALTNLAAIQHLHLLPQLYDQVTIPEAVYRELADIVPPVPGTVEVQTAAWLEVKQVVGRNFVERLQAEARLDPGESFAIALAIELGADLLLIDERRGRAEANRLGLRITGVLGILVEAKHRNLVVAVKPLIDALIAKYCVINNCQTVNRDNPCSTTDPTTHGLTIISDNLLTSQFRVSSNLYAQILAIVDEA